MLQNKEFNPAQMISLTMKYYSNFIISSEKLTSGPCLLTFSAKDIENEEELDENRTPLDLICVLDRSGSM
jgi:hypothetical protein